MTKEGISGLHHQGFSPLPHPATLRGQAVLIYAITFFLTSLYFDKGLNLWDEGAEASGTMRVLAGELPYRDFFSHPPGRFYVDAILFRWFEPDLRVLRYLWLFVTPVIPAIAYTIVTRYTSPFAGLMGALMVFVEPGDYYNRFIGLFLMLGMWSFTLWQGDGRRRGLVITGCIAGMAAYYRWDTGGFIAFAATGVLMVAAVGRRGRGFVREFLSLWVPVGIFAAPWGIGMVLDPGFRSGVLQILGQLANNAYSAMNMPYPSLFAESTKQAWFLRKYLDLFTIAWFYAVPAVYLATPFVLLASLRRTTIPGKKAALFGWLLLGVFSFNEVYWRSGLGNLAKVSAPAFLLFVTGMHTPLDWFRRKLAGLVALGSLPVGAQEFVQGNKSGEGVGGTIKTTFRGIFQASGWLFYAVALGLIPCTFAYAAWRFESFDTGSPGILRETLVPLDLPRGHIYCSRDQASSLRRAVEIIQQRTKPGEPIFVMPLAPIIYFLADRPNASWHEWLLPFHFAGQAVPKEALEGAVIEELERAKVRLIIYSDIPFNAGPDGTMKGYAPGVYRYLTTLFTRIETAGWFQVWERKGYVPYFGFATKEGAAAMTQAEGLAVVDQLPGEGKAEPLLLQSVPSTLQFRVDLRPASEIDAEIQAIQEHLDAAATIELSGWLDKGTTGEKLLGKVTVPVEPGKTGERFRVRWKLGLEAKGPHVIHMLAEGQDGQPVPQVAVGWVNPVLQALE